MKAKKDKNNMEHLKLNSINDDQSEKSDSEIIMESLYIIDSNITFCVDGSEITNNSNKEKSNKTKNENLFNCKILEFIKIIGNHKYSADFIKEVETNLLISKGMDDKLVLYSPQYQLIHVKKFYDWIYNIYETKMRNDEVQIIVSTKENTHLIRIDGNYKLHSCRKVEGCYSCIDFNDDNFIICDKSGVYHLLNIFSKIISPKREMIINKKIYRGCIPINNYVIALTSNRVISSGEDKLVLYNRLRRLIIFGINGYSFIISSNGLSKIKKNENITLLCACKKYIKGQKNGILIINYENGDKPKINHFFYDTKNFEVYCFCQIFIKDETYNRILVEKMEAIETDYFLVGGFELKRNKGMIKLYKIIYNKKFTETKIEYIQDIEIDQNNNFKGFKGPISSILQSKKNGNLLITSWDGNVYLFKPPNIEYFLFYDSNYP